MVMRPQDVGILSKNCLVLINSFASAVGMGSSFVERFPALDDRCTVYIYSWQDGGTSASLIDHLFAPMQHVLAVGIAKHDGHLDSDHRMVLCDYRLEGKVTSGAAMPSLPPGHIFDRMSVYESRKMKHFRFTNRKWAALTAQVEELVRRERTPHMRDKCFRWEL